LAEKFGLTRQTVSTRFKNLIQLGLIDDKNSDTYELVTLDNNVAWLIQSELL
jgi:predicted transcriptional regulator